MINFSLKSFLLLSILFSCTTSKKVAQSESTPTPSQKIYQTSGYEKYLLPDIPQWINFSTSAACFRQESIKFLHLKNLQDSFSLNYEQAIQVQYAFNLELSDQGEGSSSPLSLRKEETAFHKANELVEANVKSFIQPEFEKVNLVWIDAYRENAEELKKVLSSEEMDEAPPVLISFCFSHEEMKNFVEAHKLYEFTNRYLSTEILSAFSPSGELEPGLFFHINDFFGVTKKIQFFSMQGLIPVEIRGELEVMNTKN